MSIFSIHTDGGSRGNPGHAATGVVISDGDVIQVEDGQYIGIQTNNVAEYSAVLRALSLLTSLPAPEKVNFYLDSLLVVQQLNGKFAVKNAELKKLHTQIQENRKKMSFPLTFSYVPRAQNAEADLLVNKALDKKAAGSESQRQVNS
ncbi:MAG: ribonuclease HI family protein [Candidatus Woesebacteria bacterium]